MSWRLATWWDGLRGGPEIREYTRRYEDVSARLLLMQEDLRREREGAATLRGQLAQANERARLLQEFARSRVKARCAGGCGDLHFDFTLHLASDNGAPVLVPICAGCKRRREQEQARAAAAEAQPAMPA